MSPADKRYSKTGQPKMDAVFTVVLDETGERVPLTVVAKGWGNGGYADLRQVCVEGPDGSREWLPWPYLKSAIAAGEIGGPA